ncbi:MAG: glycosyltransferase [Actinobacteria bacterium]|nr:MAG: glycosyltransferase [Actinomycetota bacterium]
MADVAIAARKPRMRHRIGAGPGGRRGKAATSAGSPTAGRLRAGLVGAALAEVGLTALRWSRHRQTRGRGGELWELASPELDLTMVVPYYNPGSRLRGTVEALVEVLLESGLSFEVITVSDGSTDGSADSLAGVAGDVRRVVLSRNWGKGQALRAGLALGRGRYLGFIDADGDLPAELLRPFVSLMGRHEPDILLGSKRHPQSVVHYPPLRRAYSWGYQQLIRLLFHLHIRDTQTGIKLVRRDVLAAVLPHMVEKRFAFDLELFVVARRLGYRRFIEAPVRINERFSSTISPRAVVLLLLDTLAIFYRLRVLRFYGGSIPAPDLASPPAGSAGALGAVGEPSLPGPSRRDGRDTVDAAQPGPQAGEGISVAAQHRHPPGTR